MKITIEDIKRDALSKISGGSSYTPNADGLDVQKLASQLKAISYNGASDDTALLYLNMIKEAHYKAKKRIGLGDRISLR
jgi:hypothetical protein